MASVNSIQARPKRDALDTIMAGLNIAKGVYDIKTDMAKLDQMEEQELNRKEGYVTPKEKVEYGKEYNYSREAAPGAVRLKDDEGDLYATLKPPKPKDIGTREIRRMLPDGSEEISIVQDVPTSTPFLSAPKPKTASERLVQITEYNPETKETTTRFVEPKAGATYLAPPKERSLTSQLNEQARLDRHVQNLADDTAGVVQIFGGLQEIENDMGFDIDDYDKETNTAKAVDPTTGEEKLFEVDVPGVSVPGFGRTTFGGDKAQQLAGKLKKIFNITLLERSGSTVTNADLKNLQQEFNDGKFNTEPQMLQALKEYKRAAFRKLQQVEAGVPPDALSEFRNRGGATSIEFKLKRRTNQDDQAAALKELERRGLK